MWDTLLRGSFWLVVPVAFWFSERSNDFNGLVLLSFCGHCVNDPGGYFTFLAYWCVAGFMCYQRV